MSNTELLHSEKEKKMYLDITDRAHDIQSLVICTWKAYKIQASEIKWLKERKGKHACLVINQMTNIPLK